jgi:hypothetical protein
VTFGPKSGAVDVRAAPMPLVGTSSIAAKATAREKRKGI